MLKKMKKILTVILALSVVMSMLCSPAFATEPSSGTSTATGDETNPYVYYFNWYQYNVSPHQLSVTLTKDNTISSLRDNVWLWIFRLDSKDGDTFADELGNAKEGAAIAYCCDERTDILDGVAYKRINLEDSTYYEKDTAKKIRAIFDYGYWPDKSLNEKLTDTDGKPIYKEIKTVKLDDNDNIVKDTDGKVVYETTEIEKTKLHEWLEKTEKDVNVWLQTNNDGNGKTIKNLTAAEALTATQAAIWNCANKNDSEKYEFSYAYTSNYYKYGMNGTSIGGIVHPFDYALEWKIYKDPEHSSKDNVNLFIEYLMAQSSEHPRDSKKIIFSDNYFVNVEKKAVENDTDSVVCKVTVDFTLDGDIADEDKLTLSVKLGQREVTSYTLKSCDTADVRLTGDGTLTKVKDSEDKYKYTLVFDNVTVSEIADGITMSISGTQTVNDVYFYQPQAAEDSTVQKTSQNLVGKATGNTKVYVEKKIEIGDDEAEISKYDSNAKVDADYKETAVIIVGTDNYKALSGATFNLYAKLKSADKKDAYILVKEGLVTDETGKVTVSGLEKDIYDYYVKETAAPNGYNLDSGYHEIVWKTITKDGELYQDKTGTVAVGNTQKSTTGHVHYDSTLVGGASTSLTLTGSKTLDGVPCGGYSFTMLGEDGKEIATVKSDANGIITFPTQTYKEAGKYTYRIFEAEGSEDVIYDDAVYTVTVDVTKSGDKLIATASIYNNNDKVDQIIFENKTDTSDKEEENGNDDSVVGGSDFGDKGTGNKDTDTTVSGSEVPKTGDMFIIWAVLAILSAAALVCTHIADRRKQSR